MPLEANFTPLAVKPMVPHDLQTANEENEVRLRSAQTKFAETYRLHGSTLDGFRDETTIGTSFKICGIDVGSVTMLCSRHLRSSIERNRTGKSRSGVQRGEGEREYEDIQEVGEM